MGCSASAIADDEEDYAYLCKKHNEKYIDVYSNHHFWLEEKDSNKTTLSYTEYSKKKEKEKLERDIKWEEEKLSALKEKLKNFN